MIEKGRPWERRAGGPPTVRVQGDDAALAAAVEGRPGARVDFRPSATSDLARAIGLHGGGAAAGAVELGLDALRVVADGHDLLAVNMVVVGTPPDRLRRTSRSWPLQVTVDGRAVYEGRATTLVVASGQFLRGLDVVPRGHPGDGRAEVQAYAVAPGQRAALRRRLPLGTHVPHPRITQAGGRRIEVTTARPVDLELDGVPLTAVGRLAVEVVPEAFSVVV